MPSAIAYTRVSRGGPRENSSGLDAQRHQIEKFASDRGFDILKVYSEICAYRGKINKVTRPALFSAMSYSMRNNTYIFVASFDRITQAPATVQNRAKYKSLKFISAKPDESNDSSLPVIDIIQRNRREKISSSTKSALAALQALGVKLGNVKNLEVVRGRGSETNKQLAKQRLSEFEILLAEARSLGARRTRRSPPNSTSSAISPHAAVSGQRRISRASGANCEPPKSVAALQVRGLCINRGLSPTPIASSPPTESNE